MRRKTGRISTPGQWKWPAFMVGYLFALGWLAAGATFWLAESWTPARFVPIPSVNLECAPDQMAASVSQRPPFQKEAVHRRHLIRC
jgi:hypothetical protein